MNQLNSEGQPALRHEWQPALRQHLRISRIPYSDMAPVDYSSPERDGQLSGQIQARLERLLQGQAIDAGNGDVIDRAIDAGIAAEQARLDALRGDHLTVIQLLLIRNSGDAELLSLQLSDAQRQLEQLQRACDDIENERS